MTESKIQNPQSKIRVAGIVLAGGKSSRMGLPKATLPFGPELMLHRVNTCRIGVDELRAFDPQLNTLRNLNRPGDYLDALREAGFEPPDSVLAALGTGRT